MIGSINLALAYTTRVEEVSATVTLVGEALPGTTDAQALWRIKKIDSSSIVEVIWAEGSDEFNKVWDDRASYTYS